MTFFSSLGIVCIGTLGKLLISFDDFIWLGYFFATQDRLKSALLYVFAVTTMQMFGFTLGYLGIMSIPEEDDNEIEFTIQVVAGILLIVYATYIWTDGDMDVIQSTKKCLCHSHVKFGSIPEEDDIPFQVESGDRDRLKENSDTFISYPDEIDLRKEVTEFMGENGGTYGSTSNPDDAQSKKTSNMYIVACLGSVDECVAFTILVFKLKSVDRTRSVFFLLMLGGAIATFLIVSITAFITLDPKVRDWIEQFPDFLVFYALGCYMLIDSVMPSMSLTGN